jgi:plasmid stabilization system protein ParE
VIAVFHPAAQRELVAAIEIGEERAQGLGHELLQEVERAVNLLCQFPNVGEPLDGPYRRLSLRRFPFGIIYRIDRETLRVLALAHRRQSPRYWTGRG